MSIQEWTIVLAAGAFAASLLNGISQFLLVNMLRRDNDQLFTLLANIKAGLASRRNRT